MESLPAAEQITQLHEAYNRAMNMEMPMRPYFERMFFNAVQFGITPEMLSEVVKDRRKRVAAGIRYKESLHLRNLIGSDEAMGDLMCESLALLALKRKVIDVARASVLHATNRPSDFQGISGSKEMRAPESVRPTKEVLGKCLDQLRNSVNQ